MIKRSHSFESILVEVFNLFFFLLFLLIYRVQLRLNISLPNIGGSIRTVPKTCVAVNLPEPNPSPLSFPRIPFPSVTLPV